MKKGLAVENFACAYLEKKQLKLIQKNFRSRCGEIDLIMRDQEVLVFVEVRYRRSEKFGGALESIDFRKQRHIINTAEIYLLKYPGFNHLACRFDVILASGNIISPRIDWIKNAFEC